jgi:LPXTG-site transpeptidase (sortase) family protein
LLLVTNRWDGTPEGVRSEATNSPARRPGAHRTDRRSVVVVPERGYRVNERPHRVDQSQPPVTNPTPDDRVEYRLAGQILAIVAVLALSFLIELTVLGGLRHDRDQARLAALFRIELAQGHDAQGHDLVAPVGPFDDAGKPLAAGAPVALLEIPRLGLREVVVEGTSSGTLMSGPGHLRTTPLPGQVGNSVIAGRRATYGGPFRNLYQLRAGDRFTVTTGQGKSSFAVLDVRHAGDPVPRTLPAGHGRLTLVTTDGPALAPTDALRVDADLMSEAQPRPPQLPAQVLPRADAMMVGDTSALWGVVAWSVLLVGAAIGTVWVRFRTGLWQAWVIGVPVLVTLGLLVTDAIAAMLPNLL